MANPTAEVDALVLRARQLAQDSWAPRCEFSHIVWACVEHEPGEAAVILRRACKHRILARRPDVPPELAAVVAAALAAVTEPLDRMMLLSLAASHLKPGLRAAYDDWSSGVSPTTRRAAAPVPVQDTVLWERLEYEAASDTVCLELTQDGTRIYKRTTRLHARTRRPLEPTEVEITTLKSERSAEMSFRRRIDSAFKRNYIRRDPVRLPLPSASSKQLRKDKRDQAMARRQQRVDSFADELLTFFAAWQKRGYDPARSFHQEAQRLFQSGRREKNAWNAIAAECVALAAAHFGVRFNFLTEVDEEHGTVGPLPNHRFADAYESPARVARIVLDKLRHGNSGIDALLPSWRPSSAPCPEPDDVVSAVLSRFMSQGCGRM